MQKTFKNPEKVSFIFLIQFSYLKNGQKLFFNFDDFMRKMRLFWGHFQTLCFKAKSGMLISLKYSTAL